MTQPILFQRIEGLLIFLTSLYFYTVMEFPLIWFFVLLFSIDLTILGYIWGNKIGAYTYNIGHSFALPIVLLLMSPALQNDAAIAFSLIWIAHNGMDRALGYGLKFPTGFYDTHLGKIGKK